MYAQHLVNTPPLCPPVEVDVGMPVMPSQQLAPGYYRARQSCRITRRLEIMKIISICGLFVGTKESPTEKLAHTRIQVKALRADK